MKALIVYGTRYGATSSTSEQIAKTLNEEGFDTDVVNAKDEKISSIVEYDLVIVGSGMKIDRWTKEPEIFLKKFQKDLMKKKLAIFVSSAIQAIYVHEGNSEAMERSKKKYLEEKADKYSLNPVAIAIFGGVLDYDNMGWLAKKTVGQLWRKFEEAGYKKKDGRYDTRDWNSIKIWTKDLVKKIKS